MTKGNAIAALQKTYDDCHLVCSTAIYFEGRNDESEALRCWKNALDQISYHNHYRLPSTFKPKSETEAALYKSLKQLELQCKERIDLLEAIRKSRKEAEEDSNAPPTPDIAQDATQGWLGNGTIRPMDYPDLAKPPSLPIRPLPSRSVSGDIGSSRPLPLPPSPNDNRSQSRTPSPEKQSKMKTTLRATRAKKAASRQAQTRPPAAAKAASQAWISKSDMRSLAPSGIPNNYSKDAANNVTRLQDEKGNTSSTSFRSSQDPFADFDGTYLSTDHLKVASGGSRTNSLIQNPDPSKSRRSELPPNHFSYARDSGRPSRSIPQSTSIPRSPVEGTTTTLDPYSAKFARSGRPNNVSPDPYSSAQDHPSRATRTTAPPIKRKPVTALSPSSTQVEIGTNPSMPLESDVISSDSEIDDSEDDEPLSPGASWKLFSARVINDLPRGIDAQAAEQILNEIIIQGDEVHWDDIAGLEIAKAALKENVVYPFLRPDLFMGLREPARGMLLFGPPGTGKTMLARAVATESKSTFFAISASSLISKFLGESEKLVRALFALAKMLAPSIIFVDEIDSLLSSRNESGEHEASRRIKTEFLIQWSDLARAAAGRESSPKGKTKGDASRVLVLAATNVPWAIDDAARRRFVRRQYIPLPENNVRGLQIKTLLAHQKQGLTDDEVDKLVDLTEGFSGSDITALAKDAAMGPLRSLGDKLLFTKTEDIRPIGFEDFKASLQTIRPSVSKQGLQQFEDWANDYGERGG